MGVLKCRGPSWWRVGDWQPFPGPSTLSRTMDHSKGPSTPSLGQGSPNSSVHPDKHCPCSPVTGLNPAPFALWPAGPALTVDSSLLSPRIPSRASPVLSAFGWGEASLLCGTLEPATGLPVFLVEPDRARVGIFQEPHHTHPQEDPRHMHPALKHRAGTSPLGPVSLPGISFSA